MIEAMTENRNEKFKTRMYDGVTCYAIYKNATQIGEYVINKNSIRLTAANGATLSDIIDAARSIAKYFQLLVCVIFNHKAFYISCINKQMPSTEEMVKEFEKRSR